MKIGFANVNAFEIKGKDLKKTIFSPFGILVYEGRELIFKSLPDLKFAVYRPTSHPAEYKEVFLSKEFDKVQQLEDDTDYLVTILNGAIIIHKHNIYGDYVVIQGENL
ncbi:MAG: hypothetical protein L7H07_02880 [Candidatus Nanopusillus sp.]|nr:hypothetical protein [Candidatus Nanopusillus sp.]